MTLLPKPLASGCNRMDSSYDRRSYRSSRRSRSPSRRRESERRRSSSRHAASHRPSRSSTHRQPENRWTRSQERSTGGAVSPVHSQDAYMPFDKVNLLRLECPEYSPPNQITHRQPFQFGICCGQRSRSPALSACPTLIPLQLPHS